MPARSKIDQLPLHIREVFERELLTRNFCGYEEIADWLNDKLAAEGLEIRISPSGAHRFGQGFQARCEDVRTSTEMAKSLVGVVGDDEGNLNEATIRLIQTMTFDLLLKAKKDEEGNYDVADILPKVGVMVAKLSKASVDQKKFAAELRQKATAAADDVVKAVKKGGMSEKTAEEIRKKILGIV